MFNNIRNDMQVILKRDPAAKSKLETLLYPSLMAMLIYRWANKLYKKKRYFRARLLSQWARHITGIEIHPGATIGKGVFIDHGTGVVIGETAVIGDNVLIYHGVTLGGIGNLQGKRHPTVGDNVTIGAGAKLLGAITIGDNCKIGANAVVLESIPEGATAVGVPARIIPKKSSEIIEIEEWKKKVYNNMVI